MKKIQAILLTGLMVLAMTISTSTLASAQTASGVRSVSTTASKVQPPNKVPPQCGSLTERACFPASSLNIFQVVGVIASVAGLLP
jgi:hypothetical protein